jgi:hypothetical protein
MGKREKGRDTQEEGEERLRKRVGEREREEESEGG